MSDKSIYIYIYWYQTKVFPASYPKTKKRNIRGVRKKSSKVDGGKEAKMKHVHTAEIFGRWVYKRQNKIEQDSIPVYLFTFPSSLI